ncbi:hypothetical protein C8F01DRAFT_572643 [Mycena amicta]|nr:hypothetical protein C8F01DRAFT_572643 [Mycena amicta]
MHILVTGATGYIGGSVLARLLSHPLQNNFTFTLLVRSSDKASALNRVFGHLHHLKVVVGSNSDLELLRQLAAEAEVVIACTDADDLAATKAILSGLRDRYSRTRVAPTLIHTVSSATMPKACTPRRTIYSDLNIAQLEGLPADQPHRDVDLAIVEADAQCCLKSYIILPSTIYGLASGPLVDNGIQNPRSQQIPRLVDVSLRRGQGGMVGKGRNYWGNVHVDDVAELFIQIFDLSMDPSPPPYFSHGRAGFYFAENGEHTLYMVGEEIARVLARLGKGTPTPTTFTAKEMSLYFPGGTSLGTNSRSRAERGLKIGWRPLRNTEDMLSSIQREVELSM